MYDSFDELVISNPQDVLVEAYMPGCPACGALAPRLGMLASLLKHESTFRMATIVRAGVALSLWCIVE